MKKFSVITINYNNKDGLKKTLDSIAKQTSKDYELIVIDGGSTDGGTALLDEYKDYITYSVSEPDNGVYNAQNKGVKVATGEYCIFMNSGDFFYSNDVLEKVAAELEDGIDIAVGSTYCVKSKNVHENHFYESPTYLTLWRVYVGINHQASFIKRNLLLNNPYDESMKISSDWKFFLQELILNERRYQHLNVVVAQYDMNGISCNETLLMKEKHDVMCSLFPTPIIRQCEDNYNYKTDIFHFKMNFIQDGSVAAKIILFLLRIFIRLGWNKK